MIFGYACLWALKSIVTLDKEDLKRARDYADQSKTTAQKSITKGPKLVGYARFQDYTQVDLHAYLVYLESLTLIKFDNFIESVLKQNKEFDYFNKYC